MLSVNIGPLAMASSHLILLVSLFLATLAGWWTGRHRQRNPEKHLFNLLLLGLVVARLAFVLVYFEHFKGNFWQIIDIRDGGFLIWPGIGAALLAGAWLAWRDLTLRLPLGAALAVGLIFWGVSSYMLHALQQGTQLPEMTLLDVEGEQVALQDLNGRPLVINLWATWCPPCRREMPMMTDLAAAMPEVDFIFANQGEDADRISAFLTAANLPRRDMLRDPGSHLTDRLGAVGMPSTLIFNADGALIRAHTGEISRAALRTLIETAKEP